jgi:hypothetical protein
VRPSRLLDDQELDSLENELVLPTTARMTRTLTSRCRDDAALCPSRERAGLAHWGSGSLWCAAVAIAVVAVVAVNAAGMSAASEAAGAGAADATAPTTGVLRGSAARRARLAAAAAAASSADDKTDDHEPPEPMLALPGPLFPSLDFAPGGSGRRLVVAGHTILADPRAHPPDSDAHEVMTATSVWSCAVVVAK